MRENPFRTKVALTGAFGGAFPHLFPLAIALVTSPQSNPYASYWLSFLFGVLIFAAMGAGIALIWGEKNLQKVFYLGLGLPAFLQLSVARMDEMRKDTSKERPASQGVAIVPEYTSQVATAALLGQSSNMPYGATVMLAQNSGDTLRVNIIDLPSELEAEFRSPNATALKKVKVTKEGARTLAVPNGATSVVFRIGGVESEVVPLTQGRACNMNLDIKIDKNPWSGFLNAIGLLSAEPYNINVRELDNLSLQIIKELSAFRGRADFFMYPQIPCSNVAAARKFSRIPGDEKILGLIDATIFGGKNSIVIGAKGVYWHAAIESKKPGPGFLPYTRIGATVFEADKYQIIIDGVGISLAGSSFKPRDAQEVLVAVRRAVNQFAKTSSV